MANEINIDLGKRRSLKANIGAPGYLGKGDTGTGIARIDFIGNDKDGGNVYRVYLTDGTYYDITAPKGAPGSGGSGGDSNEVWLPAVSDGVLTWTKSDSDIPPAPANIKGADGADGVTPHIGDNGNWYIGLTDTGKPSRGAAGANGKDGAPGKDGAAGSPGITPSIGANGNWYLGTTDTGKPSRGETGLQGPAGPVGPQGPQGEKGDKGDKGADGKTPVKGTDYWTAADKQEIIDDIHPAYYIDLAGNYPNYTCSVAMDDIKAAYNSGYNLVCRFTLSIYTATLPLFVPMPAANIWIFSGSGALAAMDFPAQSLTIAINNGTVLADNVRLASTNDIPTALKNPQTLTFTGAATGGYDGSTPLSVYIPSAVTDDHINELISTALNAIGVAEEGAY